MNWFKLNSDFLMDGKILKLTDKELRIWLSLIALLSKKRQGTEPIDHEFTLELNSLILSSKSRETSLITNLKQLCNQFQIDMKLISNEDLLLIKYPKFMKLQYSYSHQSPNISRSTSRQNRIEENRIEENRIHTCQIASANATAQPVINSINQCKDVMEYFNSICKKKLTLNKNRKKIIDKKLAEGISIDNLKEAILNFSKDTWEERHKFCDLIYVIGTIRGIDNYEKWFNMEKCNDKQRKNNGNRIKQPSENFSECDIYGGYFK